RARRIHGGHGDLSTRSSPGRAMPRFRRHDEPVFQRGRITLRLAPEKPGESAIVTWMRRGLAAMLLLVAACATPSGGRDKLGQIDTIVVIYAENHSFDNLYGLFPGANGIANAQPEQTVQRDHDGTPLPDLHVWGGDGKPDPA